MPDIRVFNGGKSALGLESALDVDENPLLWEKAQQELAQAKADEQLKEFQRAQMHREFALSFSHYAQQGTVPRGLVLPLFVDIAHLGFSVILELRALGMDMPIEIPHCGDFKPEFQQMIQTRDPLVRVYDVCEQALKASNVLGSGQKLFCGNRRQCHERFRGFSIKIISVVFSQFQEVMLVDADTLFFQNPMKLWDLPKYKQTGTLFFHDRISSAEDYLAERIANTTDGKPVSSLHAYLSNFDVAPYRPLANIPRELATLKKSNMPVKLHFAPSDFLLSSHSWNLRAGHEMDSSLLLWNKTKQPRATAILASFLALNGIPIPPSYGDKELFFIACELAETQYSFSDYGVGSLGTDLHDYDGKRESVLCGGGLHYFPDAKSSSGAKLLYLNSDDILVMNVNEDKIYRSEARPAEFYAGSFAERDIPQECPFDIKALPLTADEKAKIAQRQQFHEIVRGWKASP
jgi:hypothetical protein